MQYITIVLVFFALVFDKLNIFMFLLLGAILHETGHIIACILLKVKPKIVVSLFGIKLCNYPEKRISKLIVLVAGPLINLILSILSFCFIQIGFSLKIYIFMCVNFVLLFFNMLPIHFLDGGQIVLLFCDDIKMRKTMDICGIILLSVTVIAFSENLFFTISALIIFIVYYISNKNDLHLF